MNVHTPQELAILQILHDAKASTVGLIVRIETDPSRDSVTPALRARQMMYRFRAGDPELQTLNIRLSPDSPDTELWIINTGLEQKQESLEFL